MFTAEELSAWLESRLREAAVPSDGAPWRVSHVLVTAASAASCGLRLPPHSRLLLAGGMVSLDVLKASAPDVWVELISLGDATRSALVHLPLTLGLRAPAARVYGALREDGYTPVEARLVATAVAAPQRP